MGSLNNKNIDNSKEKDLKCESKEIVESKAKGFFKSVLFFGMLFTLIFGISKYFEIKVGNDISLVPFRSQRLVLMDTNKEEKYDVIVDGDSLVHAAISPLDMWNEYGIVSCDSSTSGQYIQEAYYMAKTVLEKQKPKVFVLETNLVFKDVGNWENCQKAIRELEYDCFPGIRYHDAWRGIIGHKKYNTIDYKGFIFKERIGKGKNINYMVKSDKVATIPAINKFYLDEITKLCKENDCKLCLLTTPSQKTTYGSKFTKYEEYNCLNKYAKENSIDLINMNYMCMNKEMEIDWTRHAYDYFNYQGGEHLNAMGAKIASSHLGDCLVKKYNLEDHRNDKKYEQWSKDFEEFDKVRNKTIELMLKNNK